MHMSNTIRHEHNPILKKNPYSVLFNKAIWILHSLAFAGYEFAHLHREWSGCIMPNNCGSYLVSRKENTIGYSRSQIYGCIPCRVNKSWTTVYYEATPGVAMSGIPFTNAVCNFKIYLQYFTWLDVASAHLQVSSQNAKEVMLRSFCDDFVSSVSSADCDLGFPNVAVTCKHPHAHCLLSCSRHHISFGNKFVDSECNQTTLAVNIDWNLWDQIPKK